MKVLVAGGAGFIGSNLIDALLEEGHQVVCVDNYFIGTKENVKHLSGNPNFKMYEQDICDLDALKKIFENEKLNMYFIWLQIQIFRQVHRILLLSTRTLILQHLIYWNV